MLDLEMKWSEPLDTQPNEGDGQKATWSFDGLQLGGCKVTVRTDAAEIIRNVDVDPRLRPKGNGVGRDQLAVVRGAQHASDRESYFGCGVNRRYGLAQSFQPVRVFRLRLRLPRWRSG